MSDPLDLPLGSLQTFLETSYQLELKGLEPLDLGADPNTFLYRALSVKGKAYFLKLRRGNFNPLILSFPKLLQDQGLSQIIAPLLSQKGELYTEFKAFKLMLFPFIEGANAYHKALSSKQWQELGQTLKRIHSAAMPDALKLQFSQETYSNDWRKLVNDFQTRIMQETFSDAVAGKVVTLLLEKQEVIKALLERTESLAKTLQNQALDQVPCHADLHAGNIHLTDDTFYLVDWDTLILAPKERDLMFIGAGLFGNHLSPQQEQAFFYQGYRETNINQAALAYFRFERIIQDIAVYCQELLGSSEGGEARAQSFTYLASNFLPGGTLELAYRSDTSGL